MLDLKKFKKVSSDKKHTVLKHENGHEIKIAHSGLTGELKKGLDAMPLDKNYAHKYADGGDVQGNQQSSGAPPININFNGPPGSFMSDNQMPPANGMGQNGIPNALLRHSQTPMPQAQQQATGVGDNNIPNALTPNQVQTPATTAPQESAPEAEEGSAPEPTQASQPQQAPTQQEAPQENAPKDIVPMDQSVAAPSNVAPQDMQQEEPQKPFSYAQAALDEANRMYEDKANGHFAPIKAKTYAELFADKGLPDKILGVASLILGGIGSGLTHTPNAALQMIDNYINRDLEAQKNNNASTLDFHKIASETLGKAAQAAGVESEAGLRKAMIPKVGAETEEVKQRVGMMPLEAEQKKATTEETRARARTAIPAQAALQAAEARKNNVESSMVANELSKLKMNQAFEQSLLEATQKYPPGSPQYQAAQNLLPYVAQLSAKSYDNLQLQAQGKAAWMNMFGGAGANPAEGGDIDMHKWNQLNQQAQMKMPGAPSTEDLANMTKEADEHIKINKVKQQYNNAVDELSKRPLGGVLMTPHEAEAFKSPLAMELSRVEGLRSNPALLERIQSTAFPQATDWGKTKETKKAEFNKMLDSLDNHPSLDRFGLVKQQQAQPQSSLKEGMTGTYNGKPVVVKNGKWVVK